MWLVVTFVALLASIAAFFLFKKRRREYKLGLLVLMLAGTFLMVLVDHVVAFIEDGTFIETTTDGLIKNASLLGVVMVLSVLVVWMLALIIPLVVKRKYTNTSEQR